MGDDETFRNMPSLAPSDPPSRSDEVDNQLRHRSYTLDELIGILSQLNRDEGNSKLDDLDTKLTDKLDDLDNQHVAMFKLCAVVAAFIALIYWGDKNDPWWFSAFKGVAYLWFLNWIGKK